MKYPVPKAVNGLEKDPALSLYANKERPVAGSKVAILVADGVCGTSVGKIKDALTKAGVFSVLLAPRSGMVKTREGGELMVDDIISGMPSVLVDAVLVPTGNENVDTLAANGDAKYYLLQAFKHLKAIALQEDAKEVFDAATDLVEDAGVLLDDDPKKLVASLLKVMAQHRIWDREENIGSVPA